MSPSKRNHHRHIFIKRFLLVSVTSVALLQISGAGAEPSHYPYSPWLSLSSEHERARGDASPAQLVATNNYADEREEFPRLANALPEVPEKLMQARTLGKDARIKTKHDTQSIRNIVPTLSAMIEASPLEKAYSGRVIDELSQFGYDLFRSTEVFVAEREHHKEKEGLPAGAVQDDFILSSGDALQVMLRGQRNETKIYKIDSKGMLAIEDMPPISAAGRTIGQIRDTLDAYARTLNNVQIFVSLESVRQIDVLVVGNVRSPGRQNLTVFDTVLDALEGAGGIDKSGSLRQVKLVRGGRSTIIDLYALLIHGSSNIDLSLRSGDRIMVPPIGASVAITGGVKRPGIYELPFNMAMPAHDAKKSGAYEPKLSLSEMIALAGGVLTPGRNRYMHLGLAADGRETNTEVKDNHKPIFGDGSILMVASAKEARTDSVELIGHTRNPGIHALSRVPTLSALLDSPSVFGPDIYPLIGLIERRDREQLSRKILSFPPLLVSNGKFDRNLQDGDVVHLFSRAQIRAAMLSDEGAEKLARQIAQEDELEEYGSVDEKEDPRIKDKAIIDILREHAVFVRGAVRQDGAWPVAEGASLDNVIAAAGGLSIEASTQNIEVTSALSGEGLQAGGFSGTRRIQVDYSVTDPASVMLEPGDTVRVNQKFLKVADNSVLIAGQVARPGRYDLMPGDRMSDLIARAGGLTKEAYPDGAIFSRLSERKAEEMRFRAQARSLEMKLASTLEGKGKDAPNMDQVGAVQELVSQLKRAEAVGRITVEADPGQLAANPELDILLEGGDRVFIPQRPLTVRVAGEVLSPSALQFRERKSPRDYLMQAGGFTYHADTNRTFVVYPDGSAQPLHVSSWNHSANFIPPGSTIIVPRDPKPFDFIETARDISQILSNLAITGIFIDDIRDN